MVHVCSAVLLLYLVNPPRWSPCVIMVCHRPYCPAKIHPSAITLFMHILPSLICCLIANVKEEQARGLPTYDFLPLFLKVPGPSLGSEQLEDSSLITGFPLQETTVSAQAAVTKYHTLGSLCNRSLCSHSSGGWKSKIGLLAEWLSSKAFLFGL